MVKSLAFFAELKVLLDCDNVFRTDCTESFVRLGRLERRRLLSAVIRNEGVDMGVEGGKEPVLLVGTGLERFDWRRELL